MQSESLQDMSSGREPAARNSSYSTTEQLQWRKQCVFVSINSESPFEQRLRRSKAATSQGVIAAAPLQPLQTRANDIEPPGIGERGGALVTGARLSVERQHRKHDSRCPTFEGRLLATDRMLQASLQYRLTKEYFVPKLPFILRYSRPRHRARGMKRAAIHECHTYCRAFVTYDDDLLRAT